MELLQYYVRNWIETHDKSSESWLFLLDLWWACRYGPWSREYFLCFLYVVYRTYRTLSSVYLRFVRPNIKMCPEPSVLLPACLYESRICILLVNEWCTMRHSVWLNMFTAGEWRIVPLILNVGAGWRWVVSFALGPFYSRWQLQVSVEKLHFQCENYLETSAVP